MDDPETSTRSAPRGPILAGDIGGTHSRLALFELAGGRLHAVHRESYPSADFDTLSSIVLRYLEDIRRQGFEVGPAGGCLALAAPLRGASWAFPNLDWVIEPGALREAIGMPSLRLINDFDAVAFAIDRLEPGDLVSLQGGRLMERAPRAVIGAGTGLGAALSFWCGGAYRVVSSEAGHMDFAPRTDRERSLLDFLRRRFGHVSIERVLSGRGLHDIYRSLEQQGHAPESAAVCRRLDEEDPAAVIAELGLRGEDPLCHEALDIFASVYGAQAGNLALLAQAQGGVYIAGGIAPRILDKLRDGRFIEAFRDKGRLSDMLEQIPVFVIDRPDVGLLGAAAATLDPETP